MGVGEDERGRKDVTGRGWVERDTHREREVEGWSGGGGYYVVTLYVTPYVTSYLHV